MIITIDVGNTNTVFAMFEADRLVFESRIDTSRSRMADQYAVTLLDILRLYSISPASITGAVIGSVVPPVTLQIKAAVERLCGIEVVVVGPGIKSGLNIKIDDPSTLGADLVAGAVAAKNIFPYPSIVVDMGTITKIMALDRYGALVGGALYPGVRIGLEAMSQNTALLPLVSAGKIEKVIGTNTVDCIRSGMVIGTACMLDGLVDKYEREIGRCTLVATGGHCTMILPYCERQFEVHPYLISEGLRQIFMRNQS